MHEFEHPLEDKDCLYTFHCIINSQLVIGIAKDLRLIVAQNNSFIGAKSTFQEMTWWNICIQMEISALTEFVSFFWAKILLSVYCVPNTIKLYIN